MTRWWRIFEIIDMAHSKVTKGREPWACYCMVCVELRREVNR